MKLGRLFAATALGLSGSMAIASPAVAQASEPFIGQLTLVGFNFCPRGFAGANGQILSIAQNTALFSLYGTSFGGNGTTTFALPDLRGRSPIHVGQGPGLPPYSLGQQGGATTATLTAAQMPSHNHTALMRAYPQAGNTADVQGNYHALAANLDPDFLAGDTPTNNMAVGELSLASAGGSQPFNIRDPYIAMNWCVALQGVYPSRN